MPERNVVDKVVFTHAATSEDFARGRTLFEEYAAEIEIDLCFQNFAAELDQLSLMYGPPSGALVMAKSGSDMAGCVGLRRFRDDVCEMKRLYVRPPFRSRHLGRRLAEEVARRAREMGYRTMVLDTLASMEAAHNLYVSMGFTPSSAYYSNPLPGVKYFALDLRQRS
jgi:GNAT superfamily N-acetyltransferase